MTASPRPRRGRLVTALGLALIVGTSADAAGARASAKPFYLRDIEVGDTTLPFSPMTALIMLLSVVMLRNIFRAPTSTATASHILLEGADAEERLGKYKKEIRGNYATFQTLARQHSKCPSSSAGGKLGVFKPGMMVPPFDKAIFARENPVGTAIGPVQTNFGWHLIWIEERNLVE